MARTFRLRHLPRRGGKHFVEAQLWRRWRQAVEGAEASWREAGLSELQIEQRTRWPALVIRPPVRGAFLHPLYRSRSGRVHTSWKRISSRRARRATRAEVTPRMDQEAPVGHEAEEYYRPSDLR